MQNRSTLWQNLAATGSFILETKAVIAGTEYPATTAPVISRGLFPDGLSVGNCTAASLQITIRTTDIIPKSAEVQIEMRLRNSDGSQVTEWLPAGTLYISRRSKDYASGLITLECYDAMLKANEPYIDTDVAGAETGWPKTMSAVVAEAAARIGAAQDPRNIIKTGAKYVVPYPGGSTIMDVLGGIGAAHGGNWVISPAGKLRLIPMETAPTAVDSGVQEVRAVLGSLSNGQSITVSGVEMTDDMGISYTSGDDSTYTLKVTGGVCATQELCDALYDQIEGTVYNPFSVSSGIYDPAIELGDPVKYNSLMYGILAQETATLGVAFRGDIGANPITAEAEDEYPYKSAAERAMETAQNAATAAASASEQADDARKVAVNYLSRDSTGIMVADLNDGNQTPSTATGENVHIDNASVNIRNGQTVLAKISAALARIGAEAAKHLDITSAGVYLYSAASTLLSSFTASAVSLYINGVLRTALTAAGLKIYDTDGSTQLASFGETTQIGKTSSGSNNMLIDSNGLHVRSGTTDLTLIEADRMQIGKSSGKNLLVDPTFGFYLCNKSNKVTSIEEDSLRIGKDGTPQAHISKDGNGVEISVSSATAPVAGMSYVSGATDGWPGLLWGDFVQAQTITVQERRNSYSSFIDVIGNNDGWIQLRAYTNAGLYSPTDEKWLIYIKPDGGVVIPPVVGDFTVDKSDSEATGTARVSAIGGAGGWEAAGKVSLMASAAGNKGLYDDDNETYIIYKGTDGVVHVDGKVLGAASTQAVANNLTTTTAGSVLDARQGKALNDKLTVDSQEFKAANYAKLSASCYARRVGRVGLLYISTLTGLTASAETTLFTIPAEYRPATAVSQDCLVAGATPACVRITINTNGSVTAYNYSTSTGTRNMRCTIPYVCAGS